MKGKKSNIASKISEVAEELLPRINSLRNYYMGRGFGNLLTNLEKKASAPKAAEKAKKISSKARKKSSEHLKKAKKITITVS